MYTAPCEGRGSSTAAGGLSCVDSANIYDFPPPDIAAVLLLGLAGLWLVWRPRAQSGSRVLGMAVVGWAVLSLAAGTLVVQSCPWASEQVASPPGDACGGVSLQQCWDEGQLGPVSPVMSNAPRRPSSGDGGGGGLSCQAHGCDAYSCLKTSIGCNGASDSGVCVPASTTFVLSPAVLGSQMLVLAFGVVLYCRGSARSALGVTQLVAAGVFVWCVTEVGGAVGIHQSCEWGACAAAATAARAP